MRSWLGSLIPIALLVTIPGHGFGQTLPPPAHQRLARDIFRELIEINTRPSTKAWSSCTAS